MKKLTKAQRVYVALLAAAIVAFLVDTLFLRGEGPVQQASAEDLAPLVESPAPAPTPGPTAAPVVPAASNRTAALTEALQALDTVDMTQVREAFEPSESWRLALCPPPPLLPELTGQPGQTVGPDAQEDALAALRARQFAQTHSLMSIIRTSDGGTALVDGRLVQVGQSLAGFTLVRLTERGAVFEADGKQIELHLSEDRR